MCKKICETKILLDNFGDFEHKRQTTIWNAPVFFDYCCSRIIMFTGTHGIKSKVRPDIFRNHCMFIKT